MTLLATVAAGPLDEMDRAMLQRLHGQILLDLRHAAEGPTASRRRGKAA